MDTTKGAQYLPQNVRRMAPAAPQSQRFPELNMQKNHEHPNSDNRNGQSFYWNDVIAGSMADGSQYLSPKRMKN